MFLVNLGIRYFFNRNYNLRFYTQHNLLMCVLAKDITVNKNKVHRHNKKRKHQFWKTKWWKHSLWSLAVNSLDPTRHYMMGYFPLNMFYLLICLNFLLCLMCLWTASLDNTALFGFLLGLQGLGKGSSMIINIFQKMRSTFFQTLSPLPIKETLF